MQKLFTPFDHSSYEEAQASMSKKTTAKLPEDLSSEESEVGDDVWVTDDEFTVADGQANFFERINKCFGI